MRGQMFVITMVFMLGFLAVIQHSLLMYSQFDMSAPSRESRNVLMDNIEGVIDETVRTSSACGNAKNDLENNFYEVVDYIRKSSIEEGTIVNMDRSRIDCGAWGTENPVLIISPVRILRGGYIIEKNLEGRR
ncbi:MAG: hypothetical protein JW716_02025 [Candidatus Aenigmarchaeota archaeon]|nr:hypothetical protein [Candidatus Aenigmarchaeota archaeon]